MKDTSTGTLADNVVQLMQDLQKWQGHIDRALRDLDGMYTFDDVVAMVLRQELHLYDFDECFFLMAVDELPHYKQYHCFLGGGKFEAMLEAEDHLARVGRELGCKYLSYAGRPGWTRRMKDYGWKHMTSSMHKEI